METLTHITGNTQNRRLIVAPRRDGAALRMTPLIDMTFLLLLFFLVAANWRPKEDFLPLQLPAATAAPGPLIRPEPLIIQISATPASRGCIVQIGQARTAVLEKTDIQADLAVLTEQIRDCLAEQKRLATDPVEIACAADVKWEHLALVYNTLFGMGATDITFQMTEVPSDESRD